MANVVWVMVTSLVVGGQDAGLHFADVYVTQQLCEQHAKEWNAREKDKGPSRKITLCQPVLIKTK